MNNTTKGPGHKNATYNYSSKAARSAKEDELIDIISCTKNTPTFAFYAPLREQKQVKPFGFRHSNTGSN